MWKVCSKETGQDLSQNQTNVLLLAKSAWHSKDWNWPPKCSKDWNWEENLKTWKQLCQKAHGSNVEMHHRVLRQTNGCASHPTHKETDSKALT
jgi:hypothetical protein